MKIQIPGLPLLDTIEETDFTCKRCGKCCKKRDTGLILTPMDVFVISKYLGITKQEFFQKKTIPVISKGLPVIRIKTYGKQDECCFFSRKGCEINEVKPFQCYTYPIIPYDEEQGVFVQQPVCCGEQGERKFVGEWLKQSARYEKEKQLRKLWRNKLNELNKWCINLTAKEKEQVIEILFLGLKDLTTEALENAMAEVFRFCITR